jgi:DNA-binding response OmpR family regulator
VSSQRILVVDDSTLMLEVARNALEESGFHVATASTLAEFEAHDPTTFDLILMDVQMPELFGDDVAAIVRHVRGARARIVLFSNLDPAELATRTAEAELDGYICKRDGMDTLVTRVKGYLS